MRLRKILYPIIAGVLSASLFVTPVLADDIPSQSGTNEIYDFSSVPYTSMASGGSNTNVSTENTPSDGSGNVTDVNDSSDANRYARLRDAGTGEFRQIGDNVFAEHGNISVDELLRLILENQYTGDRDTDIENSPGLSPTGEEQSILDMIMRGIDPTGLNMTWGNHFTGFPIIPWNISFANPSAWNRIPIPYASPDGTQLSETADEHWQRRGQEIGSGAGYSDYGLGIGTGYSSYPFALDGINFPGFSLIDFPTVNQRDAELLNWLNQIIPGFQDKLDSTGWLDGWRNPDGISGGNSNPDENNPGTGGNEGSGTSLTDLVSIEHIIEYRVTARRSDVAYLITPADNEPVKWSITLGSQTVTSDRRGRQLTGPTLSWAFDIPGLYKVVAKQMYQLLRAQSMSYSVCEYWIIPSTGLVIYSHTSKAAFGDPSSVEERQQDYNAVYYNFVSDLTWEGNTTDYGLTGHTLVTYSHLVTESSIVIPAPGFEGFNTRRVQ